MRPSVRHIRVRHVLGIAIALGLLIPNIAIVAAKREDNCAKTMVGTYLQSAEVPAYDAGGNQTGTTLMGRAITLNADGFASVINRDNSNLTNPGITETQTDGQGSWSCSGSSVTIRVIDLYRWDDSIPSHSFQVDRVDFTATFSTPVAGPTLTGSLEYCSWEIPVDAAVVRTTTSSQCAAMQNGVAFHLVRPFTAVRVTP